jgi:hypothetical protein
MGCSDLSEGRVISEPHDKTEAKEQPKKPPGYRRFSKLLKQVINVPPLKKGNGPVS